MRIALGLTPIDRCPSIDLNRDDHATIDELIIAVRLALSACK